MNYKKTYTPKNGYTPLCEIGKCSLKDLEFGILELSDGQSYTYETKDREVAFIILGGKANFTANGKDYGMVGARRNVFENPKAECFYAPRNCSVKIDSPWNIKIAVCSTPIDVDSEPQAIHQADVRVVRLGVKPWERDTSFIVDGSTNAKKLTIGEAYITPGNWAGFPPHKHDVDNMPSEGVLEEVYYFLFVLSRASACSACIPPTARSTRPTGSKTTSWWSSPGVIIPPWARPATTPISCG